MSASLTPLNLAAAAQHCLPPGTKSMARKRRPSGEAVRLPAWLGLNVLSVSAGWLVNEGETHTFVSLLAGTRSERDAAVFDYRTLQSCKGVCFDFNLCVASAFCGPLNYPALRNRTEFRSLVHIRIGFCRVFCIYWSSYDG